MRLIYSPPFSFTLPQSSPPSFEIASITCEVKSLNPFRFRCDPWIFQLFALSTSEQTCISRTRLLLLDHLLWRVYRRAIQRGIQWIPSPNSYSSSQGSEGERGRDRDRRWRRSDWCKGWWPLYTRDWTATFLGPTTQKKKFYFPEFNSLSLSFTSRWTTEVMPLRVPHLSFNSCKCNCNWSVNRPTSPVNSNSRGVHPSVQTEEVSFPLENEIRILYQPSCLAV